MTCGKKSHQVDHLSRKYLKILGLVEQRPTADYLKQLIRAQQIHVPYENISKLLRRAENNFTIPDFVEFLNNLTEFNFGGTCYVQNGYFCHLLRHLGFQAQLVSATTAGRTSRDATQGSNTHEAPVSHTAIRVSFENDNYIVDLGLFSTFTGPFLLKPGHVVEAQTRNQRDRFEAIDQLSFKTQHFRNEELSRTHVSQPEPRELIFFRSRSSKVFRRHQHL